MKKALFLIAMGAILTGCQEQRADIQKKVDEYAVVKVSSPLMDKLSDKDKQVLNLFRQAGQIIDELFWEQTFGNPDFTSSLKDGAEKMYAGINYGPWDRLDDNRPFIEGFGEKPLGANYYPADITAEEFAAFSDPDKNSPYTVLRRDEEGNLKCIWYRDEYKDKLDRICLYLEEAAAITDNDVIPDGMIRPGFCFLLLFSVGI